MTGRISGARSPHAPRLWRALPLHAALAVLVALTFAPFVVMLILSLEDYDQFYHNFLAIRPPFHWENYGNAAGVLAPYAMNSVVVTASSVVGVAVFASLAAYSFARFRFAGRELLFLMVLAVMMIPSILLLVPQFLLVKSMGILDSRWALILPYVASGQVIAIFIMRSFFAGLPEELFEAARIDGAGELVAFWRIAMPLTKPALGTVAILQVLYIWNDYVWPFVVTRDDQSLSTLVVGLVQFQGPHATQWGPLMAAYSLGAAPLVILFFLTARLFMEGLTAGALRI